MKQQFSRQVGHMTYSLPACNFCPDLPWQESPLSFATVLKSTQSQHSEGSSEHCNPPHLYIIIVELLFFFFFFLFLRQSDPLRLAYYDSSSYP